MSILQFLVLYILIHSLSSLLKMLLIRAWISSMCMTNQIYVCNTFFSSIKMTIVTGQEHAVIITMFQNFFLQMMYGLIILLLDAKNIII